MKKLVIATRNRDKFSEMKEALSGVGWELVPAFDFPDLPEVVEDGKTLEENSFKKAAEVSRFTGLPALADDTGLFVSALNGDPGIYAARYAGENCTYSDNVKKLLSALKNVKGEGRKAVFKTVITIFFPGAGPQQVIGEAEGEIIDAVKGAGGFGYDPIFRPNGAEKVFAEMSIEDKNRVSHRGKAILNARRILEKKESGN